MSNPFIFGNPVSSAQFINHSRELRRAAGRINTGQSIAIVGEPRLGKTSLLEYLRAPETLADLYGSQAQHYAFCYLDAMTLGAAFTQAQFWDYALQPVREQVTRASQAPDLLKAYETCQQEGFGTFVLERFFYQYGVKGFRLILLLDEVDTLLHHKVLNSTEFFGGLRSLVSRSRGALVLVTASRQPLSMLNKATQDINPTGSPYFNFLDEIVLSPFSERPIADLLAPANTRFNPTDRRFIAQVAGGHPYLLQVAASAMWQVYDEESEAEKRYDLVCEDLYAKAADILCDTWRLWTPETRIAFMAVTLDHEAMYVMDQHVIDIDALIKDLPDLAPELRMLKKQGFIIEDQNTDSGWRIRPEAFVWWLNDELTRAIRSEKAFDQWVEEQEWGGLLKKGQRQQLQKAGRLLWQGIKDSSFFKGLGDGLGKRIAGG